MKRPRKRGKPLLVGYPKNHPRHTGLGHQLLVPRPSKRQNNKKSRRSKGKNAKFNGTAGYVSVIPRAIGWAFPRLRCNLRYQDWTDLNNVGFTYASKRYTPTYAYDVDPTLASTAMPGFSEYAGLYRFYRVRMSNISVCFCNKQDTCLSVYICPVNSDPGANATNVQDYLSNRLSKVCMVSAKGGMDRVTLTDMQTTSEFGGARDAQTVDYYCGPTDGSAAPANNWFWQVGTISATPLVNGLQCNVVIDIEVEFFELKTPSS